jgi:hypothetical protein
MSNLHTFTIVHVMISLVGIFSGLVVMFGLLASKRLNRWTALFLLSTVTTSLTGFFFPFKGLTPAIVVGVISFVVLGVAIFARYVRRLVGAWRWIYVVTSMVALYLNVFVLIVQLFQRVPSLKTLAPTQSEPPFSVIQVSTLALFVVLTVLAAVKFRIEPFRSSVRTT